MPIINANITTGGTAQTVLPASNILNAMLTATTEDGWLNFGSSITWASTGVDTAAETVTTTTPHNLAQGQAITVTTTGSLPTGISAATVYYVIVISPTVFAFASSYVNALAGTKINLTTAGSGTSTVVVQAGVNIGIPYFQNVPLFLSAAEYPDITKAWSIYSATSNSKLSIMITLTGN